MGLEEPLEGGLVAETVGEELFFLVDGVGEDCGEDGDAPGVDAQGEGAGVETVPV